MRRLRQTAKAGQGARPSHRTTVMGRVSIWWTEAIAHFLPVDDKAKYLARRAAEGERTGRIPTLLSSRDVGSGESRNPVIVGQFGKLSHTQTRRPAGQSAGLLEGNLCLVCLVATTVMMAAVTGELPVCQGVASVEALPVIVADKAAIREWAESATRDRVRPPLGQSVIEAPPLLDQLPASVYTTVAVTIEPSPTLRESAGAAGGAGGD